MIAAGMLATTISQAIFSSAPMTERRRRLCSHATRYLTRSPQKYATTATSVPRWSATSNVLLNDGLSCRYVQSNSHGVRIRWPDDETGRSSVKPCTKPSASACQSGSFAVSSAQPKIVSRTAMARRTPAVL